MDTVTVTNKPNSTIKKRRFKDSDSLTALMFLAPFLILWLVWFFYPFMQSFLISLQKFDFMQMDQSKFIGLDNYIKLFVDNQEFWDAILHTIIIVVVAVPLQTILSLVLAMALNRPIYGKVAFRTIYITPYITSCIAAATIFMFLFRQDYPFTTFFTLFGFPNDTWTGNPNLALLFVIILFVWQQIGFYMIIYLAGLQQVPQELYEAARMDGATGFKQFLYVTIPTLKPVTFFVVSYGTIQSFQIFDQVAAISRYGNLGSPAGATTTLITYFYTHGIRYTDEMGLGCAAIIVFMFIILGITYLQRLALEEKEG